MWMLWPDALGKLHKNRSGRRAHSLSGLGVGVGRHGFGSVNRGGWVRGDHHPGPSAVTFSESAPLRRVPWGPSCQLSNGVSRQRSKLSQAKTGSCPRKSFRLPHRKRALLKSGNSQTFLNTLVYSKKDRPRAREVAGASWLSFGTEQAHSASPEVAGKVCVRRRPPRQGLVHFLSLSVSGASNGQSDVLVECKEPCSHTSSVADPAGSRTDVRLAGDTKEEEQDFLCQTSFVPLRTFSLSETTLPVSFSFLLCPCWLY